MQGELSAITAERSDVSGALLAIRANLLYARPSATEKELTKACEAARIWELISSVVVLDESTAHLDSESEVAIQRTQFAPQAALRPVLEEGQHFLRGRAAGPLDTPAGDAGC